MKKENNDNLEKISKDISNNFKEVEKAIKEGNLSKGEKQNISHELDKGIFLLYKFKVDLRIEQLGTAFLNMTVRDALINLLTVLRPDTPAKTASQVADYISKEWEKRTLKIAA